MNTALKTFVGFITCRIRRWKFPGKNRDGARIFGSGCTDADQHASTDNRALHRERNGKWFGGNTIFDLLFANDYWYLIKGRTENILESAARAGETGNFRVVGFDESAGLNNSGDFHGSGATVAIQSMMSCQLDLVNRLRNAANLPAYGSPFFRCDSDFLGRENQLLKSAE